MGICNDNDVCTTDSCTADGLCLHESIVCCGDGTCAPGVEDQVNGYCAQDCCGDGTCGPNDGSLCPADCS